jgi:hypothetical protein
MAFRRLSTRGVQAPRDFFNSLLAEHYGFTPEELDFIVNYDIKYRLGRGAEEE